MFAKISIRFKIVSLSGLCLLILISIVVGLSIHQNSKSAALVSGRVENLLSEDLQALLMAKAGEKSSVVKSGFSDASAVLNQLFEQVLQIGQIKTLPPETMREELNHVLQTAVGRNGQLLGIYLVMEPNSIAGSDASFNGDLAKGSNESGRLATYWSRTSAGAVNTPITEKDLANSALGISGTPYNAWYTCPSLTKQTCLLNPYVDTVGGEPTLLTTIARPVMVDGEVIGVVGVDIALQTLQSAAKSASRELFDGSGSMIILSTSGTVAASSSKPGIIGQPLSSLPPDYQTDIESRRLKAAPIVAIQDTVIRATLPFVPVPGVEPWTLVIDLPVGVLNKNLYQLRELMATSANRSLWIVLPCAAIAGLLGLFAMWLVASNITKPLNTVAARLKSISEGEGI